MLLPLLLVWDPLGMLTLPTMLPRELHMENTMKTKTTMAIRPMILPMPPLPDCAACPPAAAGCGDVPPCGTWPDDVWVWGLPDA